LELEEEPYITLFIFLKKPELEPRFLEKKKEKKSVSERSD
jgi:hypothetical protein